MSPGCACCPSGNANTTVCGPCNLPATGTAFNVPVFTATLTYRAVGGGTGSVTKSLYWFSSSNIWCSSDPANPTLGCSFTLTDYDTAGWLTDNASLPCTNFTTSSNHILQVSCSTGSTLIRHLVSCAGGTPGRTFTFTVSSYPLTSTTCSGSAGGSTLILTRTATTTNPDKTFTLNW